MHVKGAEFYRFFFVWMQEAGNKQPLCFNHKHLKIFIFVNMLDLKVLVIQATNSYYDNMN